MQKSLKMISYVNSKKKRRWIFPAEVDILSLSFCYFISKSKKKKTGFQGDEDKEEEVGHVLYILSVLGSVC